MLYLTNESDGVNETVHKQTLMNYISNLNSLTNETNGEKK